MIIIPTFVRRLGIVFFAVATACALVGWWWVSIAAFTFAAGVLWITLTRNGYY